MSVEAVQEVIDELDAHRARYEEFCRSLTREELDRPVPQSTWLVRDFIAHLATIDGPVSEMFKSMHLGEDAGIRDADAGKFDIDDWNDKQVERRRMFSVEEVLAEAAAARADLKSHMGVLTDEDLARTLRFGGDSKRPASEIPFGGYLRGWCKHDPMHAMDMSRGLPERVAGLADWFNDPIIQGYQRSMNN